MKNKLRLIDVSILSSYMGKALTVFVTLFVVGVAVSALVSDHGAQRNVIRVCVPAESYPGGTVSLFEPLRSLIARETRRPVILVECSNEWPRGFDVYVMPVDEYFRVERDLDLAALYEVRSSPGKSDKAIVIARASEGGIDFARLSPRDIAFSHPMSVNGFWVQAEALSRSGFDLGNEREDLRFEGARRDAGRVVYGVVFGAFRLGACKLSELSALSDRGAVDPREVRVVNSFDVLPETVIAAGSAESRYFDGKIGAIARLLDGDASSANQDDTVGLLKANGTCGLERLRRERLDEIRGLFERFGALAPPPAAVRP